MLCAKKEDNSPRKGDEGGPLMIQYTKDRSKWWLYGIILSERIPSVYTRTTYFVEWIYEKLLWG